MMEINKSIHPSSNMTDHFKFIPFVTSTGETNQEVNQKAISHGSLSGEEASQFYKEIISAPSTSLTPVKSNSKRRNEAKNNNSTVSSTSVNAKHTIFYHAQNGNIDGVKYSLSKHNSVDVQDMYGWTALMCATCEGHYEIVKYLLMKGANVNLKNNQGLSAFDIAAKNNNKTLLKLFSSNNSEHVQNDTDKANNVEQKCKFCSSCNISYVESTMAHEKSIAHLFANSSGDASTYYHIPENNRGFQIMLKKGWDKNKGLGADAKGRKFPIKTVLKTDRACIGGKKDVPKVTHFGPNDYSSVNKSIQPTLNMKRENKLKKKELQKLQRRNRQMEINFRRQFQLDDLY